MKKIIIAFIALIVLGGGYTYSKAGSIGDMTLGGATRDVVRIKCNTTATTTPTYMAAGAASSTCQAFIGDATEMDLRFMVNSTTTPATLSYEYYVSDDSTLADRNWFLVNGSNAIDSMATSTNELIPYRSYHETELNAKYLRVNYTVNGAAADVYLEISKDNHI